MVDILANDVVINIEGGYWRMFNMQGKNTLSPFFTAFRGEGLIRYLPDYGNERGLPGNILAADYIKAVVVGFDPRRNCWSLGIQMALNEEGKPVFVEFVNWPAGTDNQYEIDSSTAGRILAEYLNCPLKLFGVKKTSQAGKADPRATRTGPLVPHDREDIDITKVKLRAGNISLPMTLNDTWIGLTNKTTLVLRLPKDAVDRTKGESPAFQQVVIDSNAGQVKLLPPTGLLGSFFGSGAQGRIIRFAQVRNVELRHTITNESFLEKGAGGVAVDSYRTAHEYGLYLSVEDESVMLLRLRHVSTGTIKQRTRLRSTETIDVDRAKADIEYYGEHEAEKEKFDRVANFTEGCAFVVAAIIGKALVKTLVGNQNE